MTVDLAPIEPRTCVVRDTGARRGRHVSITPHNTASRHLHFGRIVLEATDAPITFSTGELETGLLCLKGTAIVDVAARHTELNRYDALYVPRDSEVTIFGSCDIAEIAAPVS
jgi:5-deoxy-glucuronate isomerase